MARDMVVYFSVMPTQDAIQNNLDGYLSDFGSEIKWNGSRWFITLPGKPESTQHRPAAHDERWFEVFLGTDSVDVITREADEFTNVVASGFAKRIARMMEGKIEATESRPIMTIREQLEALTRSVEDLKNTIHKLIDHNFHGSLSSMDHEARIAELERWRKRIKEIT